MKNIIILIALFLSVNCLSQNGIYKNSDTGNEIVDITGAVKINGYIRVNSYLDILSIGGEVSVGDVVKTRDTEALYLITNAVDSGTPEGTLTAGIGSTFLTNGGEISIYSTTGDTEIWDIAFLIEKTYHGR